MICKKDTKRRESENWRMRTGRRKRRRMRKAEEEAEEKEEEKVRKMGDEFERT